MADVEKTVKGLSQLGDALKQLPEELRDKVVRAASRKGAAIIQADAQANAPKKTGKYAQGIKVTTKVVGTLVISKVTTSGEHGYLGNWLEFGTAAHEITPKVARALHILAGVDVARVEHPGSKPIPHMRPALDKNVDNVVQTFMQALRAYLDRKGIPVADVPTVGSQE